MSQTHFQQVPLELVKRIAVPATMRSAFSTHCEICRTTILVEHCNTDENGRAVHEKCYTRRLREGRS